MKNMRKHYTRLAGPQNMNEPVQMAAPQDDLPELPRGIRWVTEKGLTRLRRVRLAISKDADLQMPPIRVHPVGWRTAEAVIFARAKPIPFDDGQYRWGAEFPASTLLCVQSDEVLHRILCHEYAHCFWFICAMLNAKTEGKSKLITSIDTAHGFEREEQSDNEHLADPSPWFGKWDVEHFMGDYDNLAEASELFAERWVGAHLPTITPDRDTKVQSVTIPDEVWDRAMKLIQVRPDLTVDDA
jgi:hypothetical protein